MRKFGIVSAVAATCLASGAALLMSSAAWAADAKDEPLAPELVKVLAAEKEARKACKIELCKAVRNKDRGSGPVSCKVIKTVPKQDLNKLVSKGKISWPYGHASCVTQLNVSRDMLVDAVSQPTYKAAMKAHTVNCTVKRENKSDYKLAMTVTPTIEFKDGKAVKAELKWGKLEAPLLAKGVIWPATALDNKVNVFGSKVVEIANTFMTKKCDEVKDALN